MMPKVSIKNVKPVEELPFEDTDYQKAIQESLKSSNSRNQLHEANTQTEFKLRRPNEMVGLMNVGNTCYFNAIIQVLFQIKNFRDKILQCNIEAGSKVAK